MKIEIEGDEMFRFTSEQEWINKAQSWFRNCGVREGGYISVDSLGRVCRIGSQFMRATKENTYPIVVYKLSGL